jgi:FkbM family methyltransferase
MIELPPSALRAMRHYIRHAPVTAGKRVLVDRVLNPRLKRAGLATTTRTRHGFRIPVNTSDIHQRYLYVFGHWEPNLTAWLVRTLRPGDGFIDVGANLGYFAMLAGRLVGDGGQVLAVEASPSMYARLLGNLSLNAIGNVRAVQAAVGDRRGELTFYQPKPGNPCAVTSFPAQTGRAEFRVAAAALPQLATAAELAAARVIKVDVEGGEHAVSTGLAPALAALRPDVELVIEVNPDVLARQSVSVDRLLEPWLDAGFHAYRLDNSHRPSRQLVAEPTPPRRVSEPITRQTDLVLSRVDAETL